MHAVPKTVRWTTLKLTANAGDNQLYLTDSVIDWLPGDRIVIATTSMNYKQSEVGVIASVSSDRMIITLVDKLINTHVGKFYAVVFICVKSIHQVKNSYYKIKMVCKNYVNLSIQSSHLQV